VPAVGTVFILPSGGHPFVLTQSPQNVFMISSTTRRSLPFFVMAVIGMVLLVGVKADEVENGPPVASFRGEVTGRVKSAQADGQAFVLTISKAEVDAASSSLKESAPLLGKELSIGVRMPKNADGVASPHADDVAYIKTLKPGIVITVKIFSVHSNPQVLRIQGPGQSVEGKTKASESK
jgi:hypothetical protein